MGTTDIKMETIDIREILNRILYQPIDSQIAYERVREACNIPENINFSLKDDIFWERIKSGYARGTYVPHYQPR